MKEQKSKYSHEAVGTYKGKEVILIGEIYEEPIRKTEVHEMYSKLDIIIDGVIVKTLCDPKKISEEKNKEVVDYMAANIEKILDQE